MLRLVKTAQKVNKSSRDRILVQLPVQNYTNLQCFMMHAAHGWKAYWVYFHTQQMAHHFDFSLGTYISFSGDYSRN